jgi:hypothetical protein
MTHYQCAYFMLTLSDLLQDRLALITMDTVMSLIRNRSDWLEVISASRADLNSIGCIFVEIYKITEGFRIAGLAGLGEWVEP